MLSILVHILLLTAPALAATAEEWSTRTIYQIITDRFATSDDAVHPCDTNQRKYCGGTWKGIIRHLDYIQNMGFDAIWISPVSANLEGNTTYGEAFHGYWTQDFTALNSHFGTDQDLRDLSAALHSRGMLLMLDVVINHVAAPSIPGKDGFTLDGFYHPFTDRSYFHPQCFVGDSRDQSVIEQCWLGDEAVPLPDLNTEDERVVQLFGDWVRNLVRQYSVDGLRIDTAKHIRKDFWPGWGQAAGVFTMGEVLTDETAYAAPYTDVLDAILDYPSYFQLFRVFSSPQGRFSDAVAALQRAQAAYRNGLFRTGSFIENHDQPRLASATQDRALITNAMVFSFVHDGIPITYYGSEQGYQGGGDPSNREALWLSAYEEDKPLFRLLQSLNAARRQAMASSPNFLKTPMQFYAVEEHSVAVLKPPMLALLTNVGSDTSQGARWIVPRAFAPHALLIDVLTCAPVLADANGGVDIVSQYGMPQVRPFLRACLVRAAASLH
ncbi:glycoside hydrolase family 13 protein [Vararia minispora EC-137]|uniref:Glycoside hydrolase family 13 protein n=1 Tax=Vararia minispora EC-137 TaxID=1314806 RepID=A0ACB8QYR9_9AGAM|nr:glycoside hydrolase family 13 protein [Vararia minispora EC-137]